MKLSTLTQLPQHTVHFEVLYLYFPQELPFFASVYFHYTISCEANILNYYIYLITLITSYSHAASEPKEHIVK